MLTQLQLACAGCEFGFRQNRPKSVIFMRKMQSPRKNRNVLRMAESVFENTKSDFPVGDAISVAFVHAAKAKLRRV